MPRAALPLDEDQRVAALHALGILDTGDEERFDRLTRTAARVFRVPIAIVTLVDANRQWAKSCVGFAGRELPREHSFCQHALVLDDELLVTEDAEADPRFADNPLVTGPDHIRFYAGHVLRAGDHKVGTLCILDRVARRFDDEDAAALADLAAVAQRELENTELTEALHARTESETRLRTVMDAAGDGIIAFDDESRVLVANPAAAHSLGCTTAQLAGARLTEVLRTPPADDQTAERAASAVRRDGVTRRFECHLLRADATAFPAELVVSASRLAEGATGVVAVFRDLSQRYEVDRLKDEFVSVVSHELRTPLTSIRGSLGLMAGGVLGTPPEGFGEMLSIAIANSERLIRLVNDILDLERMESGRVGMAPTATDARSLVDQAVSVVRPVAEAAGVEIVHDVPEQPLHVDADRIVQVFTNLLDNAVKFSPPGSTVHVTAARDAGELRVAVRDQGRGIPADQLETVFERFSQVDASDSRLRGGTGLGLAICRRIVAEHGGRIWAESRPGDGATFVCSLPTELRRPPLGKSPPPSAR